MNVILSVDPITFPLTGIGRYTLELARGLQSEHAGDLKFYRSGQLHSDWRQPVDAPATNGRLGLSKKIRSTRLARGAGKLVRMWRKPLSLEGLSDHIFHGTNYHVPRFDGRKVVTVHDLSVYLWPQHHPRERVIFVRAQIEHALKHASAIITDTEFTRREVASFFNHPLERIHAVHLASAAEFRPHARDELQLLQPAYGLEPCGYTLFLGTVEPRKNLSTLLDAYARLPSATRMRWPLVIVGDQGWKSDDLHSRFDRAQREGWLKYLGFAQQDQLPILVAGARVFAYPSMYEGFGLPVLEAMASGVPVICSNASTLPEVAGDAAAFHAPDDVAMLTQLLQVGLEDAEWREQAIKAGLAQNKKFSWTRCVRETLDVYRSTMGA